MVDVKAEDLSAVGDKVRDLINWVRVCQKEEMAAEGGTQKISDEVAENLVKRLEDVADAVGQAGGGVVESKEKEHEHKEV